MSMEVNTLVLLIAVTICVLCAIAYRWGFADGKRSISRVLNVTRVTEGTITVHTRGR